MQNTKKLTYKQAATASEIWQFMKAVSLPIIILLYSMITITAFDEWGTKLLSTFIAVMWGFAVIESIFFGSQRKQILNETLIFIGIYNSTLLLFKFVISILLNTSTEQLIASFNMPMATTSSQTLPNYLSNAMQFASVMGFIGFIGMQVKRIFQFKKKTSIMKTEKQLRSIRNS